MEYIAVNKLDSIHTSDNLINTLNTLKTHKELCLSKPNSFIRFKILYISLIVIIIILLIALSVFYPLIVIFFNKDPNKTFFDFIFIDSIKLPLTYKLMLFKLYSSYGFLDKYNKVEWAYNTIFLIDKDSSLYDLQKKINLKFHTIINTSDIKKNNLKDIYEIYYYYFIAWNSLCAPKKQRIPMLWIKNVQLPPYKHVINILHLSIVKQDDYFLSCCASFFPSNSLSEEQKEIKQEKDLKKKDILALGFADLQKHIKEYILPLVLKYFDLKEDFKEEDLQAKKTEYMDKATPKNDSFYDKDTIEHYAKFLSDYLKYKKDISP